MTTSNIALGLALVLLVVAVLTAFPLWPSLLCVILAVWSKGGAA